MIGLAMELLTLLAPAYFRGSKTRAEAATASANKIGVSNTTQGYKHDTGLQTRHRATNTIQGYKHDTGLQT